MITPHVNVGPREIPNSSVPDRGFPYTQSRGPLNSPHFFPQVARMNRQSFQNQNRDENSPFEKKRRGFTLLEVIVVFVILVVGIALLLPATRNAGPAARRSSCKNNLKQIGLALHKYHDQYRTFPPAFTVDADGKPLHSWRTLILPFVEQQSLYDSIDLSKPWDDPANAEAYSTFVRVYDCPSSPHPENHTTYLAVVSPNSFFRPTEPRKLSDSTGHNTTIAVIEVPVRDAVHWMSPHDADEQMVLGFGPDSELPHEDGTHALYVDGSVQWVSSELSLNERRAMIQVKEKNN